MVSVASRSLRELVSKGHVGPLGIRHLSLHVAKEARMDDTAITLKEAIKQVNEWLDTADHGCRTWGGHSPLTSAEQRFYDMYLHRWAAFKEVSLLLSKISVKESE